MAGWPYGCPALYFRTQSIAMSLAAFARLIPFLVVIIAILALYQFYTAIMFAVQSMYAFALFNAVFGFSGVVLARALWNHRKGFGPPAA